MGTGHRDIRNNDCQDVWWNSNIRNASIIGGTCDLVTALSARQQVEKKEI
jgi:hypothetical protein